jgi:hypothetical protein
MIRNEPHNVGSPLPGVRTVKQSGLSEFDGQKMAVIMTRGARRVVLCGTAVFVRDDTIGNTLNIRLDDCEPGHPVVVISENEWNGRIVPDFHFGCDFCLVVG